MEWIEAHPEVEVLAAEYQRLLGYPPGHVLDGRSRELADWARAWYAEHGRPWVYAREVEDVGTDGGSVGIEGVTFHSDPLRQRLQQASAGSAVLAAVSAGPEIEREAQKRWREEKPDEYYFLEVLGSAVVERLASMTGGRLCAWAEGRGMAVLPHYSPGYPEWDIAEQSWLLELLKGAGNLPGNLEVLESGALRPKKSLLAVFGLTRHTGGVRRLTELVACESCSLAACQYRRKPLAAPAAYAVPAKALRKWAQERLSLRRCEDGTVDALFLYEGTTCTNMGRAMSFQYRVKLGPREAGYPIREQECAPDALDTGHASMCRYKEDGEALLAAIASEKPLLGRRLDEVLGWARPASGAGCYCEPASREHKWGLALETIHYALARQDAEKP
jgi:hypothetical protein